jgi:hypothetical protein
MKCKRGQKASQCSQRPDSRCYHQSSHDRTKQNVAGHEYQTTQQKKKWEYDGGDNHAELGSWMIAGVGKLKHDF